MTDQHPITPPPELVQQWQEAWYRSKVKPTEYELYIANCAAEWGADTELEACCEWLAFHFAGVEKILRAARRTPPSLKEQALIVLNDASLDAAHENILRRALEALPND